jgi:hypothetical protein
MKRSSYLLSLLVLLFLFSCSINKLMIRQTGNLLEYGVEALYEESDLQLAEQALASDIKLLEGMLKGDPENKRILLLTTQALAGYALGFVEDESPERAKVFYLRARDYGLRALEISLEKKPTLDHFKERVAKMGDKELAHLFWTAFSWSGWINLSLDNPRAFIDLPYVETMMQHVLDLDEAFFLASAHLFFGTVWGIRPVMLGGDPQKAREHFDRNVEITEGKFLLSYIYYARYAAAKTLDEELFDQLLVKVEETPADVLPAYQLLNMIAKKKARLLKQTKGDLF